MIHSHREQGMKIAFDSLSPERITSAQSIDKVVTSATAELDFHGCAMELFPYSIQCDPRPDTRKLS